MMNTWRFLQRMMMRAKEYTTGEVKWLLASEHVPKRIENGC